MGEAVAATSDLGATICERWQSIQRRDWSSVLPEADQLSPPNAWRSR